MSFHSNIGTAAKQWATVGGLLDFGGGRRRDGGGWMMAPPTENPNFTVDQQQIVEAFTRTLGRPPRQDELAHFSQFVKTGDLDYNDIGQILGSLPEAQEAQLGRFGEQYGQRLGASDQYILGQAADVAGSQFRRLGRPDTSGFGAQIASAGQGLAAQRQAQLADFYGRGFGNIMGSTIGQGQGALQRGYSLGDRRTEYNRALLSGAYGYQQQKSDYERYLEQANQRNRQQALGGILGGVGGAALGSAFGPGGARIGAGIGSQAGSLFY